MYMQLLLSFIKVECLQVHTPDDFPGMDTNVTGTYSNIEHMMQSSHKKF